ncbi:hypothetical protein EV200_109153 [Pedobacter psychrotolerans]|uniref:Immunity protein 49 of polymorphic toxin system n=1 Tax=Pedobacter psychrotolerans TaxID=1843235 RepID=A0A4R2H3U8_9SPHI|nr:hypothetical protein [Pedobacter psychrotolerans]TCO19969.1 hypothetical protein EV200_109153 [Pedobacter psychrotolerans]GGE50186.1 hypothetical protein GCM10011413_15500 [Pedobacter psychrotolerans]
MIDKKISKIIKNYKEFLKTRFLEDNVVNDERNTENLNTFIQSGKDSFEYKEVVFGEEEIVIESIELVLSTYSSEKIAKSIIDFEEKPTLVNYQQLLNAYYLDLLTFILASKKLESTSILFLDADIALIYILAVSYFPEKLDLIEPFVIRGLDFRESVRNQNVRPMNGSYGRDNVLYLAYYLAKENNFNYSEKILKYCKDDIDQPYVKALENLFSEDSTIVSEWVYRLADFHLNHSKSEDLTYPFHINHWIYYPIEIISLLLLRKHKGLDNSFIAHPFLDKFLRFIYIDIPVELNHDVEKLSKAVFR